MFAYSASTCKSNSFYFFTATIEREEGKSVVFGQRSRAKGVDFERLLYIIRL